jgi:hypothetical protein
VSRSGRAAHETSDRTASPGSDPGIRNSRASQGCCLPAARDTSGPRARGVARQGMGAAGPALEFGRGSKAAALPSPVLEPKEPAPSRLDGHFGAVRSRYWTVRTHALAEIPASSLRTAATITCWPGRSRAAPIQRRVSKSGLAPPPVGHEQPSCGGEMSTQGQVKRPLTCRLSIQSSASG